MAAGGGEDRDDEFFRSYNSILFYAPDSLLKSVVEWKKDLDSQGGRGELNSPLMKKVLDEMRKDLGLSKRDTIKKVGFTPVGRNRLSKSKDIEQAIAQLPQDQLRQFRAWYEKFDADAWDEQKEKDAAAGKLDARAGTAFADHKAENSKER